MQPSLSLSVSASKQATVSSSTEGSRCTARAPLKADRGLPKLHHRQQPSPPSPSPPLGGIPFSAPSGGSAPFPGLRLPYIKRRSSGKGASVGKGVLESWVAELRAAPPWQVSRNDAFCFPPPEGGWRRVLFATASSSVAESERVLHPPEFPLRGFVSPPSRRGSGVTF